MRELAREARLRERTGVVCPSGRNQSVLGDGLAGGRTGSQVLNLGDFEHRNHGRLLGALFFGDLDLLVVDIVVNVQHHVATEAVALLLLEVGEGDDQRRAVLEVLVVLAGGALMVGDVRVVQNEQRHLRAEVQFAVLGDGGDPAEVVLDEFLDLRCDDCHVESFQDCCGTMSVPF